MGRFCFEGSVLAEELLEYFCAVENRIAVLAGQRGQLGHLDALPRGEPGEDDPRADHGQQPVELEPVVDQADGLGPGDGGSRVSISDKDNPETLLERASGFAFIGSFYWGFSVSTATLYEGSVTVPSFMVTSPPSTERYPATSSSPYRLISTCFSSVSETL